MPHSCVGEIWSGYTRIGQYSFATLLIHENSAMIGQGYKEYVTFHMLGLEDLFQENECIMVFETIDGVADGSVSLVEEICLTKGDQTLFPLPIQDSNSRNVVTYTSPVWRMKDYLNGYLKVSLIGEDKKIR